MIAGVSALLALIVLFGWMGFRRWQAGRLSPEEKLLIRCACKSQGTLHIMQTDRFPGGWVRAGGLDFDTDPQRASLYLEALNRLVALGHVEEKSGHRFELTLSGWRHTKKRPVL